MNPKFFDMEYNPLIDRLITTTRQHVTDGEKSSLEELRRARQALSNRIIKDLMEPTLVRSMINPRTYQEALEFEMIEIMKLLGKKHHDYGTKNLLHHGEQGIMIRIFDKYSRLENLLEKSSEECESIEDTYRDIIGYCLQALLIRKNQFELPTTLNE